MTLKNRAARGYLLVEAMVAGAVVAVTLLIALDFAAKARGDTSAAGMRQAASTLARAQAENIASSLPAGIADQAGFGAVTGMPGLKMKWTTTADGALGASSNPAITTAIQQINVTVQYTAPLGSQDDIRAAPAGDGLAELSVHQTWVQ